MRVFCNGAMALILAVAASTAGAEPGDVEEVAKARADYDKAVKEGNAGIISAMKSALEFQQSEARKKGAPGKGDANKKDKAGQRDSRARANAGPTVAVNG